MEKPFLFIFTKTLEKICSIDLRKKTNFDGIIKAVQAFDGIGIQSNYEDPLNAKYQRTNYCGNKLESGYILSADRPIRFSTEELIQFLRQHNTRGKDRAQRKMNPLSLKNLQKSEPWTPQSRPSKPIQIDDSVIERAKDLKSHGLSWRAIAKTVQLNPNSLRSAIRRKSRDIFNGIMERQAPPKIRLNI